MHQASERITRQFEGKCLGGHPKAGNGGHQNPAKGKDTFLRPMIAGYSLLENASRLPFGSLTATALTHSPARSWTLDTGEGKYRKSLPDWATSLAVPAIDRVAFHVGRIFGPPHWPDCKCPLRQIPPSRP
jgi:hypothetical protein